MITWIVKMIICSALLSGMYFLVLEKEKMYKFNRFYLLASLVLSFLVPFITIKNKVPVKAITGYTALPDYALPSFDPVPIAVSNETHFSFADILPAMYLLVTAFLFYRFIRNFLKIYSKARKYKWNAYAGAKLVLIEDQLIPHSFFNFIFLNKQSFENGNIEKEILRHELTHVRQKHSIDVLLIEILIVFFWFNPVLYLYRKAIKLNHEFLADDAVIKTFRNRQAYQYLLIGASGQLKSIPITSQFNFSITKKRLLMMTRNTPATTAVLKQCLSMIVFGASILLFSAKETVAQVVQDTPPPAVVSGSSSTEKDTATAHFGNYAGGTEEGVPDEELNEYHSIINRVKTPDMNWYDFREKISSRDKERLEAIFMKMNLQQQRAETLAFIRPFPPLPRVVPTTTQFDNFKNGKIYGVWINGKKVNNSELNNYSAKDFAQVFISKLYGAAKKGRNYSYQADLMTNDYYQAYYDRTISDTSNHMVFQGRRKTIKK